MLASWGLGMTRDETVALFLECEAKRAEACAAALSEGKSKDEAGHTAHEAAKAHWNAWAASLLAERKAMEADGRWAEEEDPFRRLEPKNEETRAWIEAAAIDFTCSLFLVRGAERIKETAGEEKENKDSESPVKSIQLEGDTTNFYGFVFPGNTRFDGVIFSGDTIFEIARFYGDAQFESVTFSGEARFGSASFGCATFSGSASFERATFSGDADFRSAIFYGDARFDGVSFSGEANVQCATLRHLSKAQPSPAKLTS